MPGGVLPHSKDQPAACHNREDFEHRTLWELADSWIRPYIEVKLQHQVGAELAASTVSCLAPSFPSAYQFLGMGGTVWVLDLLSERHFLHKAAEELDWDPDPTGRVTVTDLANSCGQEPALGGAMWEVLVS